MDTRSRKVRKSTAAVAFHHTALINTRQPCSMYTDIPLDTCDESFPTSKRDPNIQRISTLYVKLGPRSREVW